MADYRKMYYLLCSEVDKAITTLEHIPAAAAVTELLRKALNDAEDLYIETSPYTEKSAGSNVIQLKTDSFPEE